MRVEGPDGSWWVEIRGVDQLTGGDFRALQDFDDQVNGLDRGVLFGENGEEYEISPDGVSMVRRQATRRVSRQSLDAAQTAMLQRLITAWSFSSLQLPYQAGYLDRDEMPLDARERIEQVRREVEERLRNGGPKERPGTTGDSLSTSKDDSTAPLPGSATTTAAPASGSPATGA